MTILAGISLALPAFAQKRNTRGLSPQPPAFNPGRVLVKPKEAQANPASLAPALARLHDALGARVLRSFKAMGGLQIVELPGGVDAKEIVQAYRRSGAVEYAELDYEVHLTATPNDPHYLDGLLWALNNTGQDGGTVGADIDAPEGWDVRHESSNIVIAVIDTGIRLTHEDLKDNLWINPNEVAGNGLDEDGDGFVDDVHGINVRSWNGNVDDDNGHGTHVAGIIGAAGNNGLGVTGVAWKAQLMACKFLDSTGSGYVSDAIVCIDYARAHGARVINASWGLLSYVQSLKDTIDAAGQAGIIFVAAAGNSGVDTDQTFAFYPADFSCANIVSVAATTRSDSLAYFSNWGQGTVDLGAPGMDITSTWNVADDAYTSLSGTSMAAPEVSGAFALMCAQFPAENYLELFSRVYAAVDQLPALNNKCRTGGRLNLARALNSASSRPGNDDFANRMVLTQAIFSVSGINVDATKEAGEPEHAGNAGGKSVWWSWRPAVAGVATITTAGSTFNTLLGVYTGSNVSDMSLVASNDDAGGSTSSSVTFSAAAATDYAIAVDGFQGESGKVRLNVALAPRPVNDNFDQRMAITGSVATVTGPNTLATAEPGEPLHAGQPASSSVWWSWTAATSGLATITTAGSDFDTVLAVYVGTSLSNLVLVAANDNDPAGGTNTSRVTFSATAGTTYQIAVDGYQGATGHILLSTPPLNDNFTNRLLIPSGSSTVIGYNTLASKEPAEPNHAGNAGGKSLWWSWTAPKSGQTTFSTLGSSFDTLLAVYTGNSLNELTLVAANDNNPFGGQASLVSFNGLGGVTYQIAVDGANGATGQVKLTLGSQYVISDLGTLGGGYDYTVANGMNQKNQVVGYAYNYPGFLNQAFLWTDGVIQSLGTLGGSESEAVAINDAGQVVGWARSGDGSAHGFIWQNGLMEDLGALSPGSYTEGSSINNAGQIVGFSVVDGFLHSFLSREGVMADLTPPGDTRSWCFGINESGQITGQTGQQSTYVNPFFWDNGHMTLIDMPLDNTSGSGNAINNLGQVAGEYYSGNDRAFVWDRGVFTDLGLFPGGVFAKAYGINDAGQVVGQADTTRAFCWDDGVLTDLNSYLPPNSGWVLYGSTAINQAGQIVGWGTLNGNTRAFLLTPPVQSLPRPYLVSPTNGQAYFSTADVPLTVAMPSSATNVARIEFRDNGAFLSVATNAALVGGLLQYNSAWHHPAPGLHSLAARALYNSGSVTTSKVANVSVSAPPTLSFTAGPANLTLTWPTSPSGFVLESTTNVATVYWLPATNVPEIVDGTNRVVVGATEAARFFRLRLP